VTFDTVKDYVDQARVVLQDQVAPYRFPDSDFVNALTFACMKASGWRFDLFMGRVPSFVSPGDSAAAIPVQYRPAFLNYVVGQLELRESETTDEARASSFLSSFKAELIGAGNMK
jgi:hypothetical protein